MEQQEMIRIAKRAINKRMDFETMENGDDLYGKEKFADEVWSFVVECDEIGRVAFWAKYPDA